MVNNQPRSLVWPLFLLTIVAFAIGGNFFGENVRPRGAGRTLSGCKSNLKNLATALEMYATDNNGFYPKDWKAMTAGNYLKALPTCPEAKMMTYLDYQAINQGKLHAFSFSCVGDNHHERYAAFRGSSINYPRYNSDKGLGDHP